VVLPLPRTDLHAVLGCTSSLFERKRLKRAAFFPAASHRKISDFGMGRPAFGQRNGVNVFSGTRSRPKHRPLQRLPGYVSPLVSWTAPKREWLNLGEAFASVPSSTAGVHPPQTPVIETCNCFSQAGAMVASKLLNISVAADRLRFSPQSPFATKRRHLWPMSRHAGSVQHQDF
jgi:hypothetical protein